MEDDDASIMRDWLEAKDREVGHISCFSFEAKQQPLEPDERVHATKNTTVKASKATQRKQAQNASASSSIKQHAEERKACVPPYYKDAQGHVYACDFEGDEPRYLGPLISIGMFFIWCAESSQYISISIVFGTLYTLSLNTKVESQSCEQERRITPFP